MVRGRADVPLQQPELSVCMVSAIYVFNPHLKHKHNRCKSTRHAPDSCSATLSPAPSRGNPSREILLYITGVLTLSDITVMSHREHEYGYTGGVVPWKSRVSFLEGMAAVSWPLMKEESDSR